MVVAAVDAFNLGTQETMASGSLHSKPACTQAAESLSTTKWTLMHHMKTSWSTTCYRNVEDFS